jgi:hypothetical protein
MEERTAECWATRKDNHAEQWKGFAKQIQAKDPDFERVVSATRDEHTESRPPFRLLYNVTYQARTSSW